MPKRSSFKDIIMLLYYTAQTQKPLHAYNKVQIVVFSKAKILSKRKAERWETTVSVRPGCECRVKFGQPVERFFSEKRARTSEIHAIYLLALSLRPYRPLNII